MKWQIFLISVMLVMAVGVSASDKTVIDNKKAYVNSSIGYVSQEPHTLNANTLAKIVFDKKLSDTKYDMCFRFPIPASKIGIKVKTKKVDKFDPYIKCVKKFDNYNKEEFNLTMSYYGYGTIKYDVLILPSKYGFNFDDALANGELLILDPFVAGTPTLNLTFNDAEGIYNNTFAENTGLFGDNFSVNGSNYEKAYIGRGYDFSAVDAHLNTTDVSLFGESFTIAFWLKLNNQVLSGKIMEYRASGAGINQNRVSIEDWSNLAIIVGNQSGAANLQHRTITTISNNIWYHVAFTWNTTNLSVYINGTKQVTAIIENTILSITPVVRNLTIGDGVASASSVDFDGFLDEIYIFNESLDAGNISELFNSYNFSSLYLEFFDEPTNTLLTVVNATQTNNGTSTNHDTNIGSLLIKNINTLQQTISAGSSSIPTRVREFNLDTSAHHQRSMYLLSANALQGVIQGFVVVSSANDEPIFNTTVSITTLVGGSTVTVHEGSTDSGGLITFFGDGSKSYTASFVKTGFSTLTDTFFPSSDTRTERLDPTGAFFNISKTDGLIFNYAPKGIVLSNMTNFNFTFNITSAIFNITGCNLTLSGNGTNFLSTLGTNNNTFCNATLEMNTGQNDSITASLFYELNSSDNSSFVISYSVRSIVNESLTLKTVIDDIDRFAEAGFDNLSRMILGFLIVFAVTIFVSQIGDVFKEQEAVILIVIGMIWIISTLGWFTVTFQPVVDLGKPGLSQYLFLYLAILMGGGFLIGKQMRNLVGG